MEDLKRHIKVSLRAIGATVCASAHSLRSSRHSSVASPTQIRPGSSRTLPPMSSTIRPSGLKDLLPLCPTTSFLSRIPPTPRSPGAHHSTIVPVHRLNPSSMHLACLPFIISLPAATPPPYSDTHLSSKLALTQASLSLAVVSGLKISFLNLSC